MAPSKNLFLAAVISLFVHVPFEIVAKVSLIAAAFLFVVDPIPPYSRLIAIASCWIVLKLNKYHRDSIINQQQQQQQHEEEQAEALMEIVTDTCDRNESEKEEKENDEIYETKKDM
jgi:lysyl-tRNA synthetase class I